MGLVDGNPSEDTNIGVLFVELGEWGWNLDPLVFNDAQHE